MQIRNPSGTIASIIINTSVFCQISERVRFHHVTSGIRGWRHICTKGIYFAQAEGYQVLEHRFLHYLSSVEQTPDSRLQTTESLHAPIATDIHSYSGHAIAINATDEDFIIIIIWTRVCGRYDSRHLVSKRFETFSHSCRVSGALRLWNMFNWFVVKRFHRRIISFFHKANSGSNHNTCWHKNVQLVL